MEEKEERKRWASRNKRPIAAFSIIIIVYLTFFTPFIISPEYFFVTRYTSIQIDPLEEEMFINFHFYNSETDILTGGSSFYGLGCRLDPSDSIQEFRFSIEIPWNIQSMWVKVYFDQPFGEPPSVIRSISIGQGISFELLGIEISLIIEG